MTAPAGLGWAGLGWAELVAVSAGAPQLAGTMQWGQCGTDQGPAHTHAVVLVSSAPIVRYCIIAFSRNPSHPHP